ncbi:hypothetical protein GCM10023185_06990 [Hymenobacter saemangeumensis]|uniref:Uncharacterized protein n=1 Tax=Hymenobacter saemangeumensis TaxID=1084522 RepID=A0ABP8I2D9_9BACT
MDNAKRIAELREKVDNFTVTEDEFVEYIRLAVGWGEDTARNMFRTSYAAKRQGADYGKERVI